MVIRAAALAVAVVTVLAASSAVAQEQADVSEIASALAVEQARIDQLRIELDRRSAVVAELTQRLEQLVPRERPTAGAGAETPAPPVTTPSAAPSRFAFYADSRLRYDALWQPSVDCVGCPDRRRGRLRVRFGAEGRVARDFRAVVGFGVGEVSDPNTVYVSLGDNWSRKVATWDRAYVEFHPATAPWLDVTAGKFPYTWVRSAMTFDVDFYPEGLSERASFDLSHAGMIKNVGVQGLQLIVNEQAKGPEMTIVGGQLTARIQPARRLSTLMAVTGLTIQHPELMLRALANGTDTGVRNTNATVIRDGLAYPASAFRYVNVIVENRLSTRWDAYPMNMTFEVHRNANAASSRDSGFSLRLDAGRSQRRGDWEAGWHLFRVEQDAILAGLGESDWRAPSNVVQHRFAVSRMVEPNVQLSITFYRGRTLDRALPGALFAPGLLPGSRDPWTNRVYLDLTYRY